MINIKRTITLFCISLLTATFSFSQTTYPKVLNDSLIIITKDQLKKTNLIFLERDKLIKENELLVEKINKKDELITNYKEIDSLHIINEERLNEQIIDLNKEIKKKSKNSMRNGIIIGGVGGIAITSLIFLLVR